LVAVAKYTACHKDLVELTRGAIAIARKHRVAFLQTEASSLALQQITLYEIQGVSQLLKQSGSF